MVVRTICAMIAAGLLGAPLGESGAHAAAFTWDNGGSGNLWNTSANWDPDGLPGAGDTGTIVDVGAGTDAQANVTLGGDPLIEVENGARVFLTDGTGTTVTNKVTFKSGSELGWLRYGSIGTDFVFQDGSKVMSRNASAGAVTDTMTLQSGDITWGRWIETSGAGTLRTTLAGAGTLRYDQQAVDPGVPLTAKLAMNGGHTGFFGDIDVVSGTLEFTRELTGNGGLMTNGDVFIRSDGTLRISVQSFNNQMFSGQSGTAGQPAAGTTTSLFMDSGGELVYHPQVTDSGADTVFSMVLGGTPVPAGTYTVDYLNTNFGSFITMEDSNDTGYTFHVLNTFTFPVDIPEPASGMLLAVVGAVTLLRRR